MEISNIKKIGIYFAVVSVAVVLVFVYFSNNEDNIGKVVVMEDEKIKVDDGKVPEDAVMIMIKSPKANQIIESPLEIEGEVRGSWYFEASFPVRLENEKGEVLAQGIATAQSNWMTTDFVPFELILSFNPGNSSEGVLVFEKNNPSGLPENADSYKLPVFFSNGTHTTIRVYFGNSDLSGNSSECANVYPVEREVEKIPKIGQSALEELLKGPTDEEKEKGYFSSIQEETELRGLSIQHGVAFVDFNDELDEDVTESCLAQSIRAQIEQTLKQFPTINEVQIYIGERSEDVLQP